MLNLACAEPGLSAAFTNSNQILLLGPTNAALPYPSGIDVPFDRPIARVSVRLRGITVIHPPSAADDLDILLVGPGGTNVMLMSDAGGDNAINGVELVFSDEASMALPDSGPILPGTYRPTNYAPADSLPGPAPGAHGGSLSVFNGMSAAGRWELFVVDDTYPFNAEIVGGWILEIEFAGAPVILSQPQSQTVDPGDDVALSVAAEGSPPLFYQWRLNGVVLPEQTNATLVLDHVTLRDGGNYTVVIFNAGIVVTDPAVVVVAGNTNGPPPADRLSDAPSYLVSGGILRGDSSSAGIEPGEPVAAGGGKSVWFRLTSARRGIVTLSTKGSAFDTVLQVFRGTESTNLTYLSGDDDRAGFYTSTVQFNARPLQAYAISLDGVGPNGAGGQYTVSWAFEQTAEEVPLIRTNPQPQVVLEGGTALFEVSTASPGDLYQWLFNGQPIPGATNSTHTVANFRSADIGLYSVEVRNAFVGRLVVSAPVDGEIGLHSAFSTQLLQQKAADNGNRPGSGTTLLFLGEPWEDGTSFENSAGKISAGACGPLWKKFGQIFIPDVDGVICAETTGSTIDAYISFHAGDYNPLTGGASIACGQQGNPSLAVFAVEKGQEYTVEVAPFSNVGPGTVYLTCTLGLAPPIEELPKHCLVAEGGSLLVGRPYTNWCPTPTYQWKHDGIPIPNATNAVLELSDFDSNQAGS